MKFKELQLSEKINKALEECGYEQATPIQEKTIPVILEGKDVIGQSKTGTGKTASYSLPILEKIDPNNKKVQAIILCPTRELAIQITEEIRKFSKYQENINTIAIYGGQSIETQIKMLKKGVQIVIGTPGRVMDHMRRKTLKLKDVNMVVLDEADEMLDMGFEEDIETILKEVPCKRQTLLFSATMNQEILQVTKKYLKHPMHVKIKAEELTVNNIEQISISIKSNMKDEAVMRLIDAYSPSKAIVFCNTKKKVDDLIEKLKIKGYKAESLHGDIKQSQRDRIMRRLKNNEFQILVATDVAARGIDVEDLELVINYDIPQEEEYYVHRIGRTGRNGKFGKAFTFVVGKEKNKLYHIQKYANTKIKEGKLPTLAEISERKNQKILDEIRQIIDKEEFSNISMLEDLQKEHYELSEIAKALITLLMEKREEKIIEEKLDKNGYIKLFLNVGKKDTIKVKDIVGSFSANTILSGEEIGKITVLDKFSFIEIPTDCVSEVMQSMRGKQIKGRDVKMEIAKE